MDQERDSDSVFTLISSDHEQGVPDEPRTAPPAVSETCDSRLDGPGHQARQATSTRQAGTLAQRRRTAYHEAGHAIVGLAIGGIPGMLTIRPDADAAGRANFKFRSWYAVEHVQMQAEHRNG